MRSFFPFALLSLAACGSSSLNGESPSTTDSGPTDATSCAPQAQLICACADGAQGAQICRLDGLGYSPCVCADAGANSDVSAQLPSCVPNAQVACACLSGAAGIQVCEDNGLAYSDCLCPDAGSSPDSGLPPSGCVPNAQLICACASGQYGIQVCQPDGSSYSSCACPDAAAPPPDGSSGVACVPNAQVACACWGGTSGIQICQADGQSYSTCACPDAGPAEDAAPDTAEPDVSAPDAAEPDVSAPDAAEPDVSVPDAAEPDVSAPDAAEPDVSAPDAAEPDVSAPDAAEPDGAPPDGPCLPYTQLACTCAGGGAGFKRCSADGTTFSPCSCPDAGVPPGSPGPCEISLPTAVSRIRYESDADTAYGFNSASQNVVLIDMAAGTAQAYPVTQVPLATCAMKDQTRLYVLYKNTGIAEYSLPGFVLVKTLPWSVPSYPSSSNVHFHLYCGADRLYIVDGNWAPGLWTVDGLSTSPTVVDHSVSSVGDLTLSPDESDMLVWEQYGWSAGNLNTSVSRIATSSWTTTAKTTLTASAGYSRDPLDAPVLWDRTRDMVLNKNQVFLGSDLSKVLFSFPGAAPFEAPDNIYAFDEAGGRFATRTDVYSLDDFHVIVPTVASDALQYFFDRYGRLRMLTKTGAKVLCQTFAP